jgi:hypothetical protein
MTKLQKNPNYLAHQITKSYITPQVSLAAEKKKGQKISEK